MRAVLLAALLLPGCMQAQQLIGANPQAVAATAIAVEARTGLQCNARVKAGDLSASDRRIRLEYERIGVDATIAMLLSEATKQGIERARELTDRLCPPLPGPPAETEAPAAP